MLDCHKVKCVVGDCPSKSTNHIWMLHFERADHVSTSQLITAIIILLRELSLPLIYMLAIAIPLFYFLYALMSRKHHLEVYSFFLKEITTLSRKVNR